MSSGEIAEFQAGAAKILHSGTLILGDYTARFEKSFAELHDTRFGCGVNTGTDALAIAEIYRPIVESTPISFELEPPDASS